MSELLRATDALDRAKGVNKGLDAVVSLITSTGEALDNEAIGELLWALHDQMKRHLDDAGNAIEAFGLNAKEAV